MKTEFQNTNDLQLIRELLDRKIPDAHKIFATYVIGVCFRYLVKYGTIIAVIYKLGFEAIQLARTLQLI